MKQTNLDEKIKIAEERISELNILITISMIKKYLIDHAYANYEYQMFDIVETKHLLY